MQSVVLMPQILIRKIDPEIHELFVQMAKSLGVSTESYARQVIKDSLKNPRKEQADDALKAARAMVKTMAEAFGRSLKASPEDTEKLSKILVKKFDQEVQ